MKNHQGISLIEATNEEIINDFIDSIVVIDKSVCKNRLVHLLHFNPNISFAEMLGRFVAITNSKTSIDLEIR